MVHWDMKLQEIFQHGELKICRMKLLEGREICPTIITIGARGAILAYPASGLCLQRAGYHVQLTLQSAYANLIVTYRFEFAPIADEELTASLSECGRPAHKERCFFLSQWEAVHLLRLAIHAGGSDSCR